MSFLFPLHLFLKTTSRGQHLTFIINYCNDQIMAFGLYKNKSKAEIILSSGTEKLARPMLVATYNLGR